MLRSRAISPRSRGRRRVPPSLAALDRAQPRPPFPSLRRPCASSAFRPLASALQANFFRDFKALLPADHPIKRFDKCDFGPIRAHVEQQRDLRKARTEGDKESAKADKTRHALLHGFCVIDGRLEKVGNTNMEPPSLFRGRGKHPKTGTLKQRTQVTSPRTAPFRLFWGGFNLRCSCSILQTA